MPSKGLAEKLLEDAEKELEESGIEKLSLRAVAKRAGVSHGAPAHHFGDAQGLLTALATKGYKRLALYQVRREDVAPSTALDKIVASGLGYIDFAMEFPGLFHLMFNSSIPNRSDEQFSNVSLLVFEKLVANTEAHSGQNPYTNRESMKDLMASWAVVHGLAELVISGRAERTLGLNEMSQDERDKILKSILLRVNSASVV